MADEITMSEKEVREVVEAYWSLLARACDVVSDVPFRASADWGSKGLRLWIDEKDENSVILQWVEYESDYYGGGYCTDEGATFPLSVLLMPDKDLKALRAKVKKEERERDARVRAAEAAVARDRQEARDQAEFARLKAKYEPKR